MPTKSRSKSLQVARYEFVSTLRRRSALVVMFGLPLLSLGILALVNWLSDSQRSPGGAAALSGFAFGSPPADSLPVGLVDQTGRIGDLPEPADSLFQSFPDDTAARRAFEEDALAGYFVIPADYLTTGELFYYADTRVENSPAEQLLLRLLAATYVPDPLLADRVVEPAVFQEVNLAAAGVTPESQVSAYILGLGIAVFFYVTVLSASGYLLQSLGKEKQNRVMEILLSSIRPLDLLIGKMLGLGAIGLLQLAIWSAISLSVLGENGGPFGNLNLPRLALQTWAIVIAFFVVGYLVYASLFAGLGAIAPNLKESGQYTFLLTLPVIVPLWFNTILLEAPNGGLSVAMSLFPLTAPVAMPMRLTAAAVPTWHWLLSLLLAFLTALGTIALTARIFRSQALLSGQSLSLRLLWQTLRG